MDRSRAVVFAAVTLIVGVSVVSGPAIGVIDLTTPRFDTTGVGQGNATVDQVEAPAEVRLEKAYQSNAYRLRVPDSRIHVASVSGRPVVTYELSIDSLGYTRTTSHFLDEGDDGWRSLSLSGDSLGNSTVRESQYDGTLSIVLRYNDSKRVLYRESVTVDVIR